MTQRAQNTTPAPIAPSLTSYGLLPQGIHHVTLQGVELAFAHPGLHPHRRTLFMKLIEYVTWVQSLQTFPSLFIDGSFVTDKAAPKDIDVILELPRATEIAAKMDSTAMKALDPIYCKDQFMVDVLHWAPHFPARLPDDKTLLFQQLRPEEAQSRGLPSNGRKGILRVSL
jgi:hypothetical protein